MPFLPNQVMMLACFTKFQNNGPRPVVSGVKLVLLAYEMSRVSPTFPVLGCGHDKFIKMAT